MSDGRSLREAQIEAIKTLLESCYEYENTTMPQSIYHILFEQDFNDLPAEQINSKTTAGVTDTERRTKFFNEIDTILSRRSKKKQHLLPSVILQLV